VKRTKASVAVYAIIALLGTPTLAEIPLWRLVKRDFAEFRINADPRISQNPALARVLQDRLRNAEKTVRDDDQFAHEEAAKSRAASLTWDGNGTHAETLHLLALTDRYAAILTQTSMCGVGARRCYSGEHVTLYRLGDAPASYDGTEALALDAQAGLLDRLTRHDRSLAVGQFGEDCGRPSVNHDDCPELGHLLGIGEDDLAPLATTQGILNFKSLIAGVGFTTDIGGRVLTLDIYVSYDRNGGHYQAHRWPIPIDLAAPLLKREVQDALLSASQPPVK
jgi:hypothetical protein